MIEVDSLAAIRSGNRILDAVTLTVAEGTVTTLVGPSGGGKSTLLRCLNGLETFAAGQVMIAGHKLIAGDHPPRALERVRRVEHEVDDHLTQAVRIDLHPAVRLKLQANVK